MITKIDINAIKRCTVLVLRLAEGKSIIETIWSPSYTQIQKDPYLQEKRHIIETEGYLTDYGKEGVTIKDVGGFAIETNYSFVLSNPIKLLGNILREGYSIRLEWYKGNTSTKMIEKGQDQTGVRIEIYNKKIENIGGFTFQTCTDTKNDRNHIVLKK